MPGWKDTHRCLLPMVRIRAEGTKDTSGFKTDKDNLKVITVASWRIEYLRTQLEVSNAYGLH